jgi:hypothetical protein
MKLRKKLDDRVGKNISKILQLRSLSGKGYKGFIDNEYY